MSEHWVGLDEKARRIELSDADAARIPVTGKSGRATVTDLITGERVTVRRASCGLPHCMCALAFVKRA